jgi:hypothetical protein
LDEFRAQYENRLDFPVREEFHLNPTWANLPEITPEMGERVAVPGDGNSLGAAVIPRMDAVRRKIPS